MRTTRTTAALASVALAAACVLQPHHLTVDFLPAPAPADAGGLARLTDAPRPLLGWWLASNASGVNQTQSAYRVQVAASADLLPTGPYVFDSGVVASSVSVAVPYGGQPLPSRTRVFWHVAVWDAAGESCGPGTEVGAWEVPLLTEADWGGAAWITRDAPHPPPPDCALYADDPAPLFRAAFTLDRAAATLTSARLYVAGLGYYKAFVDGLRVGDAELDPAWSAFDARTYYSAFDVAPLLAAGGGGDTHVLGVALGNGWCVGCRVRPSPSPVSHESPSSPELASFPQTVISLQVEHAATALLGLKGVSHLAPHGRPHAPRAADAGVRGRAHAGRRDVRGRRCGARVGCRRLRDANQLDLPRGNV